MSKGTLNRQSYESFIIFLSSLVFLSAKRYKPKEHAVHTFNQIREIGKPDEIVSSFDTAGTPALMAAYSVFYPVFMKKFGTNSVYEIERSIKNYTKKKENEHRLIALPAATAAHCLNRNDDNKRSEMCSIISRTLKKTDREVLEISLQNLVCATCPNIDSVRFFAVDEQIFTSIESIIDQAQNRSMFLSPLGICTEFLLNSYALAKMNPNSTEKYLNEHRKLFDKISNSKMRYSWIPARMIKVHLKTFRADATNNMSLPPQSSEVLMGWGNYGDHFREYLQLLTLNRIVLLKQVFETAFDLASGENDPDVMNKDKAMHALPKLVAFFRAFDIASLLKDFPVDNIPSSDHNLKKFMIGDFKNIISYPKKHGIDISKSRISQNEIEFYKHIPFSNQDTRKPLERITRRNFIANSLNDLATSFTVSMGYEWLRKSFWWDDSPEAPKELEQDDIDVVIDKCEDKIKSIRNGEYMGIEQDQNELGPYPIMEDRK